MPDTHRRLLISVESGTPNWTLLRIAGAADLPAVKWRLQSIAGRTEAWRVENTVKLQDVFDKADEGDN